MKIGNKKVWIILISAIVLISVFGYMVKAVKIITGVMIFRDIAITQESYRYLGNELFSTTFYLPADGCRGFITYCKYVYTSANAAKADINKDGTIDSLDAAILTKAYPCSQGESCWSRPVEECFFVKSGRRFKDPTRDCKMNSDDSNLISTYFNQANNNVNSPLCENDPICKADINQDGIVDIYDASIVSDFNGNTATSYERIAQSKSEADLNGDGVIDIFDALILSGNFGKQAIERRCKSEPIVFIGQKQYSIEASGIGINWIQSSYECSV